MSTMERPEKTRIFQKTSVIETTLADIKRFHEAPRALASLTPPPIRMKVQRDAR